MLKLKNVESHMLQSRILDHAVRSDLRRIANLLVLHNSLNKASAEHATTTDQPLQYAIDAPPDPLMR
jgi:hypothetical protein